MNNTIDRVIHHSAILELDLKSYRAEAAQMRADQAGAPMKTDSRVSDYYFGRDRRLQAISGARFSWPQTQTGQIADSVTAVLPAAIYHNSGTVAEIYFGIDKLQHVKLKEDYLRIKDRVLKT